MCLLHWWCRLDPAVLALIVYTYLLTYLPTYLLPDWLCGGGSDVRCAYFCSSVYDEDTASSSGDDMAKHPKLKSLKRSMFTFASSLDTIALLDCRLRCINDHLLQY